MNPNPYLNERLAHQTVAWAEKRAQEARPPSPAKPAHWRTRAMALAVPLALLGGLVVVLLR